MCAVLGPTQLILSVIPSPALTAPISVPPSKIFTTNLYNGPQDPSPAGVKSKWQTILSTAIVGIHIGHVPGTEKYLYVGRFSTSKQPVDNVIGVLDLAGRSFKIINTDDNTFCCGVTATADGHVAVVGGNEKSATGLPDGLKSLRIYNPAANPNRLPTVAKMSFNRWYPTGTLMANKNILVMGGTQSGSETGKPNSMFEVWDPPSNSVSSYLLDSTFFKGAGRVFYPFVYVLPTGDIFTHCDGYTRLLKPDYSYRPVFNIPNWPDASISTEYPRLGTSSISALYPPYDKVTVHVFGGASKNNKCDRTVVGDIMGPASTASFHLTMTWSGAGAGLAYNFNGGWKREEMPFPRVTFDSLLLPNGDILMTGGTQAGCSGDARLGVSRGNYPALWPVLYQPDKPAGQRFTVLSATGIARIYHGTALLTTDGLMLVSGCDSCNRARFKSNSPFLSKSPTGKKELRSELFYPPYALDTPNRPTITSVNGNTKQSTIVTVGYSAAITITWNTAALKNAPISGVTLVATSQTTHGFNTNQRVVYLTILSQDAQAGTITVKTPPGPTVAPAQVYTLWLLNGKTYANKAWWVKLA